MAKQRRPVYVVQKYMGMVGGEKVYTIICIKQTRVGAMTEQSKHEGSVIVDKYLTD